MNAFCGKHYLCLYKCTLALFVVTILLGIAGMAIPGNDTALTTSKIVVNACGAVSGTLSAVTIGFTAYAHKNGPDADRAADAPPRFLLYFIILLSVALLFGGNFAAMYLGHGWYGVGITGLVFMIAGTAFASYQFTFDREDYLAWNPDRYWAQYDRDQALELEMIQVEAERLLPETERLKKYMERYWDNQGLDLNNLEKTESIDEATRKKLKEAVMCSISKGVPENPVVTRSGQIYDRDALNNHFTHVDDRRDCGYVEDKMFCPNTKKKLNADDILPFDQLRRVLKKHTADSFDSNESFPVFDPQAAIARLKAARKRLLENTTRVAVEM